MPIIRRQPLSLATCNDREVVFAVPPGEFGLGLAFLGFGVVVVALPFVLLALGHEDAFPRGVKTAIAVCCILGGVFLFFGGVLAFRRDHLRIELESRTYEYRTGFPGSCTTRRGSLAEFDRLEMESEIEEVDEMTGRVWRVRLHWKDSERPSLTILEFVPRFSNMGQDKRQMALDAMRQISAKTGTPAFDENGRNLAGSEEESVSL